jgi:hypothetical protein
MRCNFYKKPYCKRNILLISFIDVCFSQMMGFFLADLRRFTQNIFDLFFLADFADLRRLYSAHFFLADFADLRRSYETLSALSALSA